MEADKIGTKKKLKPKRNNVKISNRSETESKIEFPINDECTSLSISPSGRHIIAGFSDGTLRIFDTTGRFWRCKNVDSPTFYASDKSKGIIDEGEMSNLFDYDSDMESERKVFPKAKPNGRAKGGLVFSKSHQKFGAVACQIHAKGVITSLLMNVTCSDDGKFAFGGVLRGTSSKLFLDWFA